MRARVPDLSVYEGSRDRPRSLAPPVSTSNPGDPPAALGLPRTFYLFASTVGVSTVGLVSFGVISFHLVDAGILPLAAVPLVYATAMGAAALGALASGYAYDRLGSGVLFSLPLMIAFVPGLSLSAQLGAVIVGAVLWGTATGVQESTVKALVADLVPTGLRGTAYGIFAAFEGAAALAGGALAGALYDRVSMLITIVVILQALAVALLWATIRRQRRDARPVDPFPIPVRSGILEPSPRPGSLGVPVITPTTPTTADTVGPAEPSDRITLRFMAVPRTWRPREPLWPPAACWSGSTRPRMPARSAGAPRTP